MSEKILIVEDDAAMLRGLKDNFAYAGYNVLTAADGEAGLGTGSSVTGDMHHDPASDEYLTIRGGGNWRGGFDEIRLGNTFADVVPEPATMVLLGLGGALIATRRKRR